MCMTRSDPNPNLVDIDSELEMTLRLIRNAKRRLFDPSFGVEDSSAITSGSIDDSAYPILNYVVSVSSSSDFDSISSSSLVNSVYSDNMEDHRILKELASPDINYQPLCIQYPNLDADFELKSGLIHLLPKFHGLAGEDPHKHLKEFHVVCSTMKPQRIDEEHIKLSAFPFSLDGKVKDWLYYLQPFAIRS